MKSALRLGLFGLLLAGGTALVVALYVERTQSPLLSTLTSSFQLFGTPVKLIDRAASRVVPVSALDERELGDAFRRRYNAQVRAGDADQAYLDAVMAQIRPYAHKPFAYRVYVIDNFGAPNAIALPGGVILVTRELLRTLHSESELVAVLAHELGHIERGHCFDTVRFQLLARKLGSNTLGSFADATAQILLHHAYSKTVEAEADAYAYELMVNSRYDPMGVGRSFGSLRQYMNAAGAKPSQHANLIRDYFASHPPLEIREAEFSERATVWWKRHEGGRRYVGQKNLVDRKALTTLDYSAEWVIGPS